MMPKLRWTDQESSRAVHLYWKGKTHPEIAADIGRTASSIASHLESIDWGRAPRGFIGQERVIKMADTSGPPISEWQQRDRDRRAALSHPTYTAAFFGDPLPGYSALDRRQA